MPSSRWFSQPMDQTQVSCTAFADWATREAQNETTCNQNVSGKSFKSPRRYGTHMSPSKPNTVGFSFSTRADCVFWLTTRWCDYCAFGGHVLGKKPLNVRSSLSYRAARGNAYSLWGISFRSVGRIPHNLRSSPWSALLFPHLLSLPSPPSSCLLLPSSLPLLLPPSPSLLLSFH